MEQGIRIRTIALICLLFSGVSGIQAQSAGDIDTLSQWRVDSELANSYGVVYDHFKYFIDGDTIIGSNAYYKVYKSGYCYEWEFNGNISDYYYYDHKYVGALREGDNKWYTSDVYNEDVLLYDFTLNVGDTIDVDIIIVDIDTVMVDGEPKKRFHLLGAGFGGYGEYIIEDVGATTGLFELLTFFENTSTMYCYAVDYVPLWINPENYPYCDLSVSISEPNKPKSISIYPNPVHSEVIISGDDDYALVEVSIYNTTGQRVLHQMSSDRRIDVFSLQHGMYVVEVVMGKQRIRQKLIVR